MGKGYRSALVEVMKPAPHAKCIVGIIASNEMNSRTDFAINTEEISRKHPYIAAGR